MAQQPSSSNRASTENNSLGCRDSTVGCLGALFVLAGIIALFIAPPIGIGMLIIGWILYQIYGQTPTGKAEAKKTAQQAAIKASAPEEIDKKFQLLKNNIENTDLLVEIIVLLNTLDQPILNKKMATVGVSLLRMYALDPEIRQELFKLADKSQSFWGNIHFTTVDFYRAALNILEKYPTAPGMKQFALNVGRWHYSKFNGGKITIAQEQSIQNDIFVRIR